MNLNLISVNFNKKNKNQNNNFDGKIYLCELTRTISKINVNEPQICNDFNYNYSNKKFRHKFKSSTNKSDSNFSKNNHLKTKKSDLFDAEIDVSVAASYDHLKQLSFHGKTIITRVPKFNTTNYKTIFEIETGLNSGLETVAEVVYNCSTNDPLNKLKKTVSINGKQKITVNNINLLVEPLTFFEISKLGNTESDFQNVFNDEKSTNFQTVNQFLESVVKTKIIKSEQTMIISKLLNNGEYLEFETDNLIQRTTVQRDAIEVLMKESFETSTLEISTKAGDMFINPSKSSERSIKNTCKKVMPYLDMSDSSSEYETCSSMHLKSTDERNNKKITNKYIERNINSCQFPNKNLSIQIEIPKAIDIENDDTLDYHSLDSLEISIPVPQCKVNNYLQTTNSLLYDDEFCINETSINNFEFRNSSCAESSCKEFLFVNEKYTQSDILTEVSSIKNLTNDFDLKKIIIDKHVEQIACQSTENTKLKNLINSNNKVVYIPSKFSKIVSQTWNTIKNLSNYVFYFGSYIKCTDSSVTKTILKFY